MLSLVAYSHRHSSDIAVCGAFIRGSLSSRGCVAKRDLGIAVLRRLMDFRSQSAMLEISMPWTASGSPTDPDNQK